MSEPLRHGSVTNIILAAFYEVFNDLGSGFLEAIYLAALAIVLRAKGLQVEEKPSLPVSFRNRLIGRFTPDLLVNGVVIVEAKAVRAIDGAGAQLSEGLDHRGWAPPEFRRHASVSAAGVRQHPKG
jgi:GxxExxY protein